MEPGSIQEKTFKSPLVTTSASRTDEWRLAEIPAANGHGNARSVVKLKLRLQTKEVDSVSTSSHQTEPLEFLMNRVMEKTLSLGFLLDLEWGTA